MSMFRLSGLASVALAAGGCALLVKGEVQQPRYFSPELPLASATEPHPTLQLRLGRISAGKAIEERMIVRESTNEVEFYEDRLWTDKPVTYLRQALTRVLFEEQGLQGIYSGQGATLDVELLAFEEVKRPKHLGRVRLAYSLRDDRLVRLQQTLTVERPVAPASPPMEGEEMCIRDRSWASKGRYS